MLPGVADVRYDREWLTRVAAGLEAVRGTGFVLGLLMALAAAVTVASVVRLGLQARHDEIEIMQLVGSPISFIRGPFIAEGVLQGGLGALIALAVLAAGFAVAGTWWVMLNAYAPYAGTTLTGKYLSGPPGGDPALVNGVPVARLS